MALTTAPAPDTSAPVPAAVAPPPARDPEIPNLPIYRLSVAQYHAMADAGILREGEPIELLEGLLVTKMTKHRPHSIALSRTRRALERRFSTQWYASIQDPITTPDSEPEPDIAMVRGTELDYPDDHPGPRDIALVVEVADSSLAHDRGTKRRVYARAGIAVYWIVNLIDRQIEVYTDPTGPTDAPTYRHQQNYGKADAVPVILDGQEIGQLAVRDLLP